MYLIKESAIKAWRDTNGLHFIQCACHFTDTCTTCSNQETRSKRQEIKELVVVLSKTYPDLKTRVFGAMQRLPLPQWGVTPHQRGSQKQLHQHDGCKAGQAEKADDAGRGRGDGNIEPGQGRE